jgi:hypothetical protein
VLRARAILAAVRPTARTAHLGPAGLTVLFGAVPAVVALARGASSVSTPAIAAALTAGAALGWAAEDPSAEVLAPLPVPPSVRTALRAGSVVAVALGLSLLLAGVVALGPGLPVDLPQRGVEAIVAALAALALGAALSRQGDRAAGASGVTAGVLLPLVVVALAYRWPRVLPSFSAGPVHDRWWLAVAVLAVLLAWAARDPARR